MIWALIRHPLVAVSHLGGWPTPDPCPRPGMAVKHHRGDVVECLLRASGPGVDDRGGPGHRHHGHGAVIRLEPLIDVVRRPGAGVFVFRQTHAELGRQADEVGIACPGFAVADIDQTQTQGSANRRIGAIDHPRPHRRGPRVDPGPFGNRSIHQDDRRFRMAGDLHVPVVHLGLGQAVNRRQQHRELLGAATGHDRVNGDLFNRRQAKARLHHHEHVLRLATRPSQHLLDGSRRGWYHRQAVTPVALC